MHRHDIYIPDDTLTAFCCRWQITELALFGSILRSDFGPNSDIDFLVTYAPDKRREAWSYFPEQADMESLLGRKVDWITRKSVEQGRNPLFQREVLNTAETIYAEHRETAFWHSCIAAHITPFVTPLLQEDKDV